MNTREREGPKYQIIDIKECEFYYEADMSVTYALSIKQLKSIIKIALNNFDIVDESFDDSCEIAFDDSNSKLVYTNILLWNYGLEIEGDIDNFPNSKVHIIGLYSKNEIYQYLLEVKKVLEEQLKNYNFKVTNILYELNYIEEEYDVISKIKDYNNFSNFL